MLQASAIKDGDALKIWLDGQPSETRQRFGVIIAHRAAIRVFPVFAQELHENRGNSFVWTALPMLRVSLILATYIGNPPPTIRNAALSAASALQRMGDHTTLAPLAPAARSPILSAVAAVRAAAHSDRSVAALAASRSASHAADAARYAPVPSSIGAVGPLISLPNLAAAHSTAASAAWREIQDDIAMLAGHRPPERSALWSDTPDFFRRAWAVAREWLSASPGHDFWIRWYEAALEGRPLTGDWDSHWQLLSDIALLPDEDWAKGAEHIAARIEDIEARYEKSDAQRLADALPLAEAIEVNPETGLFRAVPITLQNAPLIGSLLARVQDTLDDAVRGNNGLGQDAREVRVITRVTSRYGNDPQRIELDFTGLAVGLRRQFEVEDLPRSEDNMALLDAIEEGVRAIRATHPEVAANRNLLAAQAMTELTEEDRQILEEALPKLRAISDPPLSQEWAEDIPEIIAPRLPVANRDDPGGSAPALPGAVRVFSRVAKISISKQLSEIIVKTDVNPAYKGARIAATAASLVQIGIRIFGVL